MDEFPFQPWGTRIVIKPDERPEEATTKSGLVTLSGYGDRGDSPMTIGTVVAVGDAIRPTPDYLDKEVAVGTRVVYSPWAGFKLTIGQALYIILDESECLGSLISEEAISVE